MDFERQKRKLATPGKFTSSGNLRSNMIGEIGSASQAKEVLGLMGNARLKDGKKGRDIWFTWRRYVKSICPQGKNRRSQFSEYEWRDYKVECALHQCLSKHHDDLFAPPTITTQNLHNALEWAVRDCIKKANETKKASGDDEAEALDDAISHSDDTTVDVLRSPPKRRKITKVDMPHQPVFPALARKVTCK
jgi:hypothetical protein